MHEWEPFQYPEDSVNSLHIDDEGAELLDQSLREIYESGRYAHVVIRGNGPLSKGDIKLGKIAFINDSTISALYRIPDYLNLADMLTKKDPASLFEKTVHDLIGNYEIDQETIGNVLGLYEGLRLKTISAMFVSGSGTSISFPIALVGVTSLYEAIKISACFMKITRVSESLTSIREILLTPRNL